MNVCEVRKAKTELERKISELLDEFAETSGVTIAAISIDTLPDPNVFLERVYVATIKVEL